MKGMDGPISCRGSHNPGGGGRTFSVEDGGGTGRLVLTILPARYVTEDSGFASSGSSLAPQRARLVCSVRSSATAR